MWRDGNGGVPSDPDENLVQDSFDAKLRKRDQGSVVDVVVVRVARGHDQLEETGD